MLRQIGAPVSSDILDNKIKGWSKEMSLANHVGKMGIPGWFHSFRVHGIYKRKMVSYFFSNSIFSQSTIDSQVEIRVTQNQGQI